MRCSIAFAGLLGGFIMSLAAGLTPTLSIARPSSTSALSAAPYGQVLNNSSSDLPVFDRRLHYAGPVWMAITNYGTIGSGTGGQISVRDRDALRIRRSPSFEFPGGTENEYLAQGGILVGGVIGIDTLVSVAGGLLGTSLEWVSFDTLVESSDNKASPFYDPLAFAEQQYYALYTDTVIRPGIDELDQRPHQPLNLEIAQRSYAWADRFARQFIIVECWVRNIGTRPIDKMVFGVYVDADVGNGTIAEYSVQPNDYFDDVAGFLSDAPNLSRTDLTDPLNVGWIADDDGEPLGRQFLLNSPNGVIGARILHAPPGEGISYNWWIDGTTFPLSWGPVLARKRRPSHRELGYPNGDRNRYYLMSNHEIDYPQMESGLDHSFEGWMDRLRKGACDVADGDDPRFVISTGPSCELLRPGDSTLFVYAILAGNDFHTRPGNQFNCRVPENYAGTMNGTDLALSGIWASWIYDTPGLDTDGDGYRGEFHLVNCRGADSLGQPLGCDTIFYTGDLGPPPGVNPDCITYGGAPDYVGPETPPCPQAGEDFTLESRPGEIIVRWSGRNTETVRDPLSRRYDFEGYRLYVGKTNTEGQYSILASWDVDNFVRYVYDEEPPGRWFQDGGPVTIDKLRELYGPDFDPTRYPNPSPFLCFRDTVRVGGSIKMRCSYFVPQDFNRSNQYEENGFVVDNMIQRIRDTSFVGELGDTLTYGFYEAHITHVNPSEGMYVTVTAFDNGDPSIGLQALESTPGHCFDFAYATYSAQAVEDSAFRVSVYPNPYKSRFEGNDGRLTSYYEQRHEAPEKQGERGRLLSSERRIWFVNLPSEATIRIYTLDGDLVRILQHPDPFLTTYPSIVGWDLVTRNAQPVVSGIYIYRVESELGTQSGKIVIIK